MWGTKFALNKLRLNQLVNMDKVINRKIVIFVIEKFKLKNWIGIREDISNCSRGLKIYIIFLIKFLETN